MSNSNNYIKAKSAYEEILSVIKKNKDICVFDVEDLERKSKHHLFGLQLKEEYGFNIEPNIITSLDWYRFGEYIGIGLWGEKYRRTISWSDDDRQPDDELLLQISFPTGPYIFGDDYPNDLFQKFFNELKSYGPKYIDTTNKGLYWNVENASKVFNDFKSIYIKYTELNKEDFKQRRINKLKEELEKLENK